jgi:flagellar motor switch protein FliM
VQPTALVGRVEAAAPVTARLSASLDLGDISLEELHGLVPGDVIATSAPLTRPIDVAMADGQRHVFHGQLGERGGHRALRLLSPEVSESIQ